MKTQKERMQEMTKLLADICLMNHETYFEYTDKDLENATLIFSHFLMSILYKENLDLSHEKMCDLATTTGKAIRELIKVSTGKDMHEICKQK